MILNFRSLKRIMVEFKRRILFVLMCFFLCGLVYSVYVSDETFDGWKDLLLITD